MQIYDRNELVEKAKAYFDANGLTQSVEGFFLREDIKKKIHSKYVSFEECVSGIVAEVESNKLPNIIIKRVLAVREAVKGKEAVYAADVKLSVMCNMYNLFVGMEQFITVDEQVLAPFKAAFDAENNEAFVEFFEEICDGVIKKMIETTLKMLCFPNGLMGEIADIIMMIGG